MRVFFNERTVDFTLNNPIERNESDFLSDFTTIENLFQIWSQYVKNERYKRLVIVDPNTPETVPPYLNLTPERFPAPFSPSFSSFLTFFKYISAAGGLVRNTEGEWLFIFRLGHWDLPKGKVEKKDYVDGSSKALENAAIREVEEETGLINLKIIRQLPSTWHIFDKKEKNCIKQTFWFEMEVSGKQVLNPQTEEGIFKVEWIKKERLSEIQASTYRSLREFLQKVL